MLPAEITTTDHHTGGEPIRIVADPPMPVPGTTAAERRARAIEDPDVQALRGVLCSGPRGHADVHGRFVVPPDDDGAHGTIRFDDLGDAEGEVHQRNVTVFGIAFRTGEHVFSIDPHDPLVPGFVLR